MHSGSSINYNLRPAKHTERKMIVDVLRRLAPFAPPSTYQYIGLGSFYFRDFIMVHRCLGITELISIEEEAEQRARYEYNAPFACIKLKFGHSNAVLPSLDLRTRTIVWLDYDGKLSESVLTDVSTVASTVPGGSVLIVTVDARGPAARHRDELSHRVGPTRIPIEVTDKDLAGWGQARVARRIITDHLDTTLRSRNGGLRPGSRMVANQVLNFHYQDSARMLTLGWVFTDEGQKHQFSSMLLDHLDFVRSGDEPFTIAAPLLTYKELRHLMSEATSDESSALLAHDVPAIAIEQYRRIYRYYPIYAETEAD